MLPAYHGLGQVATPGQGQPCVPCLVPGPPPCCGAGSPPPIATSVPPTGLSVSQLFYLPCMIPGLSQLCAPGSNPNPTPGHAGVVSGVVWAGLAYLLLFRGRK